MTDIIEIYINNKFLLETEDPVLARHELRDWILKTPFWEQKSMSMYCYRDCEKTTEPVSITSTEKNLFFMDDNDPFVCIRCKLPSEIVGFCGNCYDNIYGLEDKEIIDIPIEDIKSHPRFIEVVKADKKYTEEIRESINKEGLKNPIVLDSDNRILIGHHRYYIVKSLGWKSIPCKYNDINFNHGYFYEGKGSNVFVLRLDGVLYMNTTEMADMINVIVDFYMNNLGNTLVIEAFLNVGSDIRLRNVFIPERGDVVDPTWYEWYIRKFNKKPKIGRFS